MRKAECELRNVFEGESGIVINAEGGVSIAACF